VFERVHLYRRRVGLLRRVAVGRAVADLVRVGWGCGLGVDLWEGGVSWCGTWCGIWCGTGGSWVDLGWILGVFVWFFVCTGVRVYGCTGGVVSVCTCVVHVWYLGGTCVVLVWYLGGTCVVLVWYLFILVNLHKLTTSH
jgi:hypothetical protein